jgi:DNA-binding CsgD family transcriptional regulator
VDRENYQYCASLSQREKEALALVAKGLPNDEIANILNITKGTVKIHLRHILEKLHARNRQHAVATAIERHLLSEVFVNIHPK